MPDHRPVSAVRAALRRQLAAPDQGDLDLQGWRHRLLDGLCSAAFWLGLLVAVPSMWGSARLGQWPLIAADVVALLVMAVLNFRRNLPYRWRAAAMLSIVYLIAVMLLFSIGAVSQIYLLAVPVLCTSLLGNRAALWALPGCSATLLLAGQLGGIDPGISVMVLSPLAHWGILTVNFMLVASVLTVSCAYLLHGLDRALVRQRGHLLAVQEREADLRASQSRQAESLAAQRAAEVSNQLKSDFLAMISHEVRTPLGGVIGMLHSALKDHALAPETAHKLRLSLNNADVLLQIINDILDFSRLEAGKMPFEVLDFDLPALLRDVLDLLADRADTRDIDLVAELDLGLPVWWRGDPTRLRQVVVNLVGNGIKFTDAGAVTLGAAVAVTAGADNADGADGGGIVLTVRDTGIGIAAEALDRLFQKFEQADAATARKYGGAGLGLAICKNIVGAMGGRIEAHSTPGVGSVFRVYLPLLRGKAVLADPAPIRMPHGSRLAVLCAEDGSTNQIILRELLGDMGHAITIADDGQAALAQLAAHDYDLVIMDSRMPRLDGLAALRRLRAGLDGVRNPQVPVIALTANATREERQRFLAAGASGFLAKPIDEAQLHAEIARQLATLQVLGKPLALASETTPLSALTSDSTAAAAISTSPPSSTSTPSSAPDHRLAALDAMFGVTGVTAMAAGAGTGVAGLAVVTGVAGAGAAVTAPRPALQAALTAAFRSEGPQLLTALELGLSLADSAAVALAAHTLRGAAALLDAAEVAGHSARIEHLADAGELHAIAPHLALLRHALGRAVTQGCSTTGAR